MEEETKRRDAMPLSQVQEGSRHWWTQNPMSYDWAGEIEHPRFSPEWFEAIDAAQIFGHRLFASKDRPFDRVIPLDWLPGKKVLEIGCGMGLHTATMAAAGANVTAIDITPTAIEATQRRLALRGLTADLQRHDAESLPFPSGSFDLVWSWGVIHHSSRTGRAVREIARVLKPDGEARVMVYNRDGMAAKMAFLVDHVLRGGFMHRTFEETLYKSTDGFSARYYVKDQFEDLFRTFFDEVSSEICGQDADAVPLPRRMRRIALKAIPKSYARAAQARRGGFIFLKAAKPV